MIPLYLRRGFPVRISCSPDKAWLFRAVGAEITPHRGAWHPWDYPDTPTDWEGRDWAGNKNGCNLSRSPLPDIGPRDGLWEEYCRPLNVAGKVPTETVEMIARVLEGLPRPIVLLHTIGNTSQGTKSLPAAEHFPLYRELRPHGGNADRPGLG